jgi:acyl-CoA thioester hydrolase
MSQAVTETRIPVRSTDVDADRNVNNAVFFIYFEQGRLAHLLRLGVIDRYPHPPGERPLYTIAATTARFRAPAFYGDVLVVQTRTKAVRTRSFLLAYKAYREADGTLLCEGSSAQVWLDPAGRPAPLPAHARAALLASLGAAAPAAEAERGPLPYGSCGARAANSTSVPPILESSSDS